jgi:hypothetical protein
MEAPVGQQFGDMFEVIIEVLGSRAPRFGLDDWVWRVIPGS